MTCNPAEDVLIWKDDANPEWQFGVQISESDGKHLALYISRDTARVSDLYFTRNRIDFPPQKQKLWLTDLSKNDLGLDMKWNKLIDEFDADYGM